MLRLPLLPAPLHDSVARSPVHALDPATVAATGLTRAELHHYKQRVPFARPTQRRGVGRLPCPPSLTKLRATLRNRAYMRYYQRRLRQRAREARALTLERRQNLGWTAAELRRLKDLAQAQLPAPEIARHFPQYAFSAVRQQLANLDTRRADA